MADDALRLYGFPTHDLSTMAHLLIVSGCHKCNNASAHVYPTPVCWLLVYQPHALAAVSSTSLNYLIFSKPRLNIQQEHNVEVIATLHGYARHRE